MVPDRKRDLYSNHLNYRCQPARRAGCEWPGSTFMFRETSKHFDRDLDQILDRVYGANADKGAVPDTNAASMRQLVVRREQGSLELKLALADLRDRREKSQSTLRMTEEINFLQNQISVLRELSEQIATLRAKLAALDG